MSRHKEFDYPLHGSRYEQQESKSVWEKKQDAETVKGISDNLKVVMQHEGFPREVIDSLVVTKADDGGYDTQIFAYEETRNKFVALTEKLQKALAARKSVRGRYGV
jgi:hypothetical protein